MIGLPDEALASKYVIKTHYVVRVIQFYPEDQTVDVIQDMFEFTNTPLGDITVKNEFGQEITVRLLEPSIIYGVPVQQLRWGQFEIQACPQPGDTGYIEVFTNDIAAWKEEGGIAIPWSDRHFVKESCVFVPFVANQTNASKDYVNTNDKLVIKSPRSSITLTDNGEKSTIDVEADLVRLGSNEATEWGVLGDKLESLLQNMILQFNTHTHTGNLGAPTSNPVTQMEYSDVKSEKVKLV